MQPKRAASWLYDVVNVLIDAFDTEILLLSRGNVSWRFYNQELEHIRPASSYLSRDGRHILRDLVTVKPAVASHLTEHDQLRDRVEALATAVYREALPDAALRVALEQARKAFLETSPDAMPTGAYPAERHIDLVIEHLINEIETLPAHQTDAEFWAAHRKKFAFRHAPSLEPLRQARTEFFQHDVRTIQWFENLSFEICTEHGIPAAPSVSVG